MIADLVPAWPSPSLVWTPLELSSALWRPLHVGLYANAGYRQGDLRADLRRVPHKGRQVRVVD